MEAVFSDKVVKQLDNFEPRIRKKLIKDVENLKKNTTPDNSKLIQDQKGRTLSRLRVKTERSEYRIFYRIENTEIKILSIRPRSECYDDEFWEELEKVFREMA